MIVNEGTLLKANGFQQKPGSSQRTARTRGILVTGRRNIHGSGILHLVMELTVVLVSALPGNVRSTQNLSVNHSLIGKMPVEVKGVR